MIDAAADTLYGAWPTGIDLAARAADHPQSFLIAPLPSSSGHLFS